MVTDGGIGTYLRNMLPRVARARPEWTFTAFAHPSRLHAVNPEAVPNVVVRECAAPIYGLREQVELPLRTPVDASVFWAPHYNFPVLSRRPVVVTVHDVCHLALEELNGGGLRSAYARYMLSAVRRRAAGILFDSEFSRGEMTRLVGACDGNAAVSPLAVDPQWHSARSRAPERPLPEPYLLYVGNLKRHKNVPALLAAFRSVTDRIPHKLVLVGRGTGLRADPQVSTISDDRVIFAGEVSADRLAQYVVHADALVTASLYEGFGLPALEAMAAGIPCLVSTAGSLPEVCGDAALYCDPRDITSIADGLVRIATDEHLRAQLVRRGEARARASSWDLCATTTASVLDRAIAP